MTILCNAPFCNKPRDKYRAWCGEHRWEREKYKVKPYYELLPLWAAKRCKLHGLIRFDQVYINPSSNAKRCLICKPKIKYCPIKQKQYNLKHAEYRRESRLNKRYNIGIQEYEELLTLQNHSCAICKIHISNHELRKGKKKKFAVDHCHKSKNIRGLLCYRCNMGLGYFDDDIPLLKNALKYLRSHK